VLHRPARGVVSRGADYSGLPPTAERLLGLDAPGRTTPRARPLTLAQAEVELDGPVEGGASVELELAPGPGTRER
jgi:hypothetical protein